MCESVCISIYTYGHIAELCIPMYVGAHLYEYGYIYPVSYVFMCLYMRVYLYKYLYIFPHRICVSVHVCVNVYMYIYLPLGLTRWVNHFMLYEKGLKSEFFFFSKMGSHTKGKEPLYPELEEEEFD